MTIFNRNACTHNSRTLHQPGAHVAGYLNLPGKTSAAFVDHPSLGRIYRTGDLCQFDANQDIVYLGRIDAQVRLPFNTPGRPDL